MRERSTDELLILNMENPRYKNRKLKKGRKTPRPANLLSKKSIIRSRLEDSGRLLKPKRAGFFFHYEKFVVKSIIILTSIIAFESIIFMRTTSMNAKLRQ